MGGLWCRWAREHSTLLQSHALDTDPKVQYFKILLNGVHGRDHRGKEVTGRVFAFQP